MKPTPQQTAGAKLGTAQRKEFGAAKVSTSNGPLWCHASKQGETLKLRRFAEGNVFEVETAWDDLEDFVSLAECKKLLPNQSSYSFLNVPVWAAILEKLQAGASSASVKSLKESAKRPVPVSRLRRYYSSMKVFDKALFEGIAKFYLEHPEALEKLWSDSRKEFDTYSNDEDWGRGETKQLPPAPTCLREVHSTNEFTAFITTSGKISVGLDLTFVEREINPWRTRNAVFPDKRPATKTGRGGIDLLLATSEGVPVIGEVKVEDDKNAFFALLQAMTYAVELSTPNQQKRLMKHFPIFKGSGPKRVEVDIAVILVNPVHDATRVPVMSLISLLNKRRKCGGLRSIVLMWNEGEKWVTHS